jgi:hypothetical protein
MKVTTEMIERLAEVRILDLDDSATPQEMIELGVELVLIGVYRMAERKRRRQPPSG